MNTATAKIEMSSSETGSSKEKRYKKLLLSFGIAADSSVEDGCIQLEACASECRQLLIIAFHTAVELLAIQQSINKCTDRTGWLYLTLGLFYNMDVETL